MLLPNSVLDIIDRCSESEEISSAIKAEVSNIVDSLPMAMTVTPTEEHGKTAGDWHLNFQGNELRPDSSLSWKIIDDMEQSAMPAFAILMKLAPILSVFRSWDGILVKSPDEELAEVQSESMRQTLPLMTMEFGFRSMIDGTCFMETRYQNTTKFNLGLAKNRLPSKLWTVAKQPHIVDPRTVTEIKRTKGRHKFDGFIQQSPLEPHKLIPVSADQALVIPNNQRFRSLWGVSALELLYRPWFWYQVFLRSVVRWGERMAVPTVIAKAPMLESLPDPNDPTTTIKMLDYAASIASSLARSSYATIPSDVDPETKVPKFALGYENASEGGVSGALLSILQELGQTIIRAAISADRATTQSSGGVGSYNIGEIHNQASQNHNQMILTGWLGYLNKYYMPWLSYHNKGVNGPPIRLEVAIIDPSYRDLLVGMMSTMGNTKPGQEALWSLDYETLLNLAHIPTLDPEEAEARRNKYEEEAMERAEEAMRRQQEMAPPPEAAEARRAQGRDGGSDLEKKANEAVKKVEAAADEVRRILDSGGKTPIYVGADQVEELIREARKPIALQEPDFDETKVSRDPGGKFASKASSYAETLADTISGVMDKLQNIGDKENAKKMLDTYGLTDEEMEQALTILENSKSYATIDDAFDDISNFLIENGHGEEEDIARAKKAVFEQMSFARGLWDPYKGEVIVDSDYGVALLAGSPIATSTLMHEILHASGMESNTGFIPENDFQEELTEVGAPTRANKWEELHNPMKQMEGRNELATLIAMNDLYGTSDVTGKSKSRVAVGMALLGLNADDNPDAWKSASEKPWQSYGNEVEVMAQVAQAVQMKTGANAKDWIIETNKRGSDLVSQEDEMRLLFPEQMSAYGTQDDGSWTYPDMDTISDWTREVYAVPRNELWVSRILGGRPLAERLQERDKNG